MGHYQSLFSNKTDFIQALFENSPINFSINEKFSRTQDLKPIQSFIPSMMGWESDVFKKNYLINQFSFFQDLLDIIKSNRD